MYIFLNVISRHAPWHTVKAAYVLSVSSNISCSVFVRCTVARYIEAYVYFSDEDKQAFKTWQQYDNAEDSFCVPDGMYNWQGQ